jgi:MFS family permease
MCVMAATIGAIFASAEVAIVAYCTDHGERSLTGPVLATLALGSGIAGFVYGGRTWHRSLLDRFRIQAVVFGVVPWIFLLAWNVGSLAVCALIVGLAVAPALITLFGMVAEYVASAALTEGLAWVLTGLNVGYGIASALAGRFADIWNPRAAFGLTIAAATALALLALRIPRTMRKLPDARLPR